jgi:acyl-CoA synthetase (AMP-forming)/AMP-acid ligase II
MSGDEFLGMTIGDALRRQAQARPDAPYLTVGDDVLTFQQLWDASGRVATGFAELGLRRGDRVTTWLPNRVEWIVAAFALARLGVVNVLANPRYRPGELAYLVAHSESRCVLVDKELGEDFGAALVREREGLGTGADSLEHRVVIGAAADGSATLWRQLADTPVDESAIAAASSGLGAQDVVYIIYTSGTTGRPKGSMTRHGPALKNAFNSGGRMGFTEQDRLLCYVTMAHCFGAVNALLNTLTNGCRLDLLDEFSPEGVLQTIAERGITAMFGVPTHYMMLADAQRASGGAHDVTTLTKGCCGGGVISPELQDAIDEHLGIDGLTHAYGMSESSAIISQSHHDLPRERRLGTAGAPMPDVEIRLVDEETGAQAAPGEPGEVHIRGFNVHAGYFMLDPDPSAREDGWWDTGDIASFDEHGCLTIRGRSKDMYKSSGFNVYPVEVEAYLETHTAVGEVAVVGIPDPRKQEVGAAFVIPAAGAEVDPEELKAFAREGLVGYKAPAYVWVVDDFPRSAATLKVQKNLLRDDAQDRIGKQAGVA